MTSKEKKVIHVDGDISVEWLIRKTEQPGGAFFWSKEGEAKKDKTNNMSSFVSMQKGGAFLINEMINQILQHTYEKSDSCADVHEQDEERPGKMLLTNKELEKLEHIMCNPQTAEISKSWTTWNKYSKKGSPSGAYRICSWNDSILIDTLSPREDETCRDEVAPPDLLVLHDSNLGFRSKEVWWPNYLKGNMEKIEKTDIIYKLHHYVGISGKSLLGRILENVKVRERTIVITRLDDMRKQGVDIRRSLSWDKLFFDVINNLGNILGEISLFDDEQNLKVRKLIILLSPSGAILIDNKKYTLIFDRNGQESDFTDKFEGELMGYGTCITAALVHGWSQNGGKFDGDENNNLRELTKLGLGLARYLHIHGYAIKDSNISFPFEALAEQYRLQKSQAKDIQSGKCKEETEQTWLAWNLGVFEKSHNGKNGKGDAGSLLQERLNESSSEKSNNAREILLKSIVEKGPSNAFRESLTHQEVPIEKVGEWRSVDRDEIEGVRSVRNAMREYLETLQGDRYAKPLCVAVFSPPGAGKSFTVAQIAKELKISKNSQLTFNISQFSGPKELIKAFHAIRDLHLEGKTPLVFWDEFDTNLGVEPLGWLRHFLAPMNDGYFLEENQQHKLGGGIYVFAGATCTSYQRFCEYQEAHISAKKPDFVSRIKAYIDVKGPNKISEKDELYDFRRALLLNQHLVRRVHPAYGSTYDSEYEYEKNYPKVAVEESVIKSFLDEQSFRYGSRSIETIVSMSDIKKSRKFLASALPPQNLWDMHVGEDEPVVKVVVVAAGKRVSAPKIESRVEEIADKVRMEFPNHYIAVYSDLCSPTAQHAVRCLMRLKDSRLVYTGKRVFERIRSKRPWLGGKDISKSTQEMVDAIKGADVLIEIGKHDHELECSHCGGNRHKI